MTLPQTSHTLIDILQRSESFLQERGIDEARRHAEEIIAHVLEVKRLDLYLRFDQPLTEGELTSCRELLRRRGKREPLQYLLKEVPFHNCVFEVASGVLIPRPETEQLVSHVIAEWGKEMQEGQTLLDLCSGSGCIGISLKTHFPQLEVTLSDQSKAAIEQAKKNASRNHAEVRILQGDLFGSVQGEKFNYLVCNPPYIPRPEIASLQPEVRDHEPREALDGGEDGLSFYRRLSKEGPKYLKVGAKLIFEFGIGQEKSLRALFSGPYWKKQQIIEDWAGVKRFFSLEFET